jgi:hypothetical protein
MHRNYRHPAPTRLSTCFGGQPRFANTGLTQDQDNMPPAGFDDPGDVLAKHIKLKLPVNQWLLRAITVCLAPFATAIVSRWHNRATSTQTTRSSALSGLNILVTQAAAGASSTRTALSKAHDKGRPSARADEQLGHVPAPGIANSDSRAQVRYLNEVNQCGVG